MLNTTWVAIVVCMFSALVLAGGAHAQEKDREGQVVIGLGVHVTTPVDQVCTRMGDVEECSVLRFFAGGDLSGHYYLTRWLALGGRFAGSKDLDASRNVSSLGETEDHDQWLWRLAAEARLHPPILPLWFSGELGFSLMRESFEEKSASGSVVMDGSATQKAALFGLGTGLDFLLGESFLLAIEAHLQLLTFGSDPPRLSSSARAMEFGSTPWVTLGLRLGYRI